MKHLKILGLAAVAAMAVMAFVGAGSAFGSTICTKNESPCAAANTIKELHYTLVANAQGQKTVIVETTSGTVLNTCTVWTILGDQTQDTATGQDADGPITKQIWENCTKLTITITPGEFRVNSKSEVIGKGSEVTVNGIFNTSCIYGTGNGTVLGTFVSGTPGKLAISALVKRADSNALCPAETRWTGTLQLTNHTSAFLVA